MELGDLQGCWSRRWALFSIIAMSWLCTISPISSSTSRWACRRLGIEFKRAHLYDINPVGLGAMGAIGCHCA
jgi:hypothetical protein